MENVFELMGKMNQTKGKIKQQLANLTNNSELLEMGKSEERLGHYQTKLGKTKQQLHHLLSNM